MNYIISIPLWMLIFLFMAKVFSHEYIRGGWIDTSVQMNEQQAFTILFCVSAIPLFRGILAWMLITAAFFDKQTVEEKLKELLEDDE